MNCLLMVPPTFNYIRGSEFDILEEGSGFFPPLGILSIAAYAEIVESVNVKIIDTQVDRLSWIQIGEAIAAFKPDVVGIQAMTFTLIDAYKLAELSKQIAPESIVVMGGPHPTLYPAETVASPYVDYAMIGEGEFCWRDFLIALRDDKPVDDIVGLVTKTTDVSTLKLHYIEDLDSLLPPARHLLDMSKYRSSLASTDYVTTMMSSRGCPGQCTFCDRPQMGKRFRKRSASSVFNEMKECVEKWGIREITFYDDTFTIDKKRVIDLCNMLVEARLPVKWDIRARIDTMNSEMIAALARGGCERIHYGVETGSPRLQKRICKNLDLTRLREVILETKKHGIETLGYFMLGLPSETHEELQMTIDLMCSLPFDYAHISAFVPFPGTADYETALQSGVYEKDYWREFALNPYPDFIPPFWNGVFTTEELKQNLRKAYYTFYSRPSYLLGRLTKVKSLKELWRKGRMGLKLFKDVFVTKYTSA